MENKETLEEAAKSYAKIPLHRDVDSEERYFNDAVREYDAFKDGAKWQAERMYSREDIENIWNEFVKELPPINNGASSDFLVYLKEFKKKS